MPRSPDLGCPVAAIKGVYRPISGWYPGSTPTRPNEFVAVIKV